MTSSTVCSCITTTASPRNMIAHERVPRTDTQEFGAFHLGIGEHANTDILLDRCACIELSPGQSSVLMLENRYVIAYSMDGSGTVCRHAETYPFGAGEGVVLFPGVACRLYAGKDRSWKLYALGMSGTFIPSIMQLAGICGESMLFHVADENEFSNCLRGIARADKYPRQRSLLVLSGVYHLIALISMAVTGERRTQDYSKDAVWKAREYIDTNYMRNIHVRDIASYAGVSERRLPVLFKGQGLGSVRDYLIRTRIAHARGILRSRAGGIAEISRAVGYEDVFYFSRIFKKLTGQSPRGYSRARSNRE